jgi:group II intron reverse transcriptase/maturase
MHHITVDMLMRSYRELNPKAAVGVDHVTWQDYGKGLKERIEDLHERVRSGRYRAQPSRRIYIPKADGKRRPIGIAALEDKIVQHAAVTVLNAIYEVDFEGFSYGFRPGRSQHQALDALHVALSERKVSWVLDADIRGFFDNLNHEWLKRFVEHRVADPGMLRLIAKWLKAGVSEDGEWSAVEVGTPQGAVISPLLANIYLHYSLDLWVNHWRKTQARGEVYFIRYADDFVAGFQYRDDAVKFQDALKQRLAKFDLEIHPDKTRLIEFGRFAEENRKRRGEGKPETFDFLGFTHICSRTRKNGRFQVKRKTIDKKLRSKIKEIRQILKRRRHQSVAVLGAWLASVTRGWYQYYAVPTNYDSLESFRWEIAKAWYDALRRRSQKARRLRWDKMKELVDRWLPQPRILHPWPYQRFNERLASRPKAGAV